jgi:hypothetical protein
MKFLTPSSRDQLLVNGRANRREDGLPREDDAIDHKPVVKLFTPDANCTWLLTELDPDEPTEAFGLCDLGLGCPELGYVSLSDSSRYAGHSILPSSAICTSSQTRRYRPMPPRRASLATSRPEGGAP